MLRSHSICHQVNNNLICLPALSCPGPETENNLGLSVIKLANLLHEFRDHGIPIQDRTHEAKRMTPLG